MKGESKFKAVVDGVEGNSVVLLLGEEQDDSVDFPKSFLPPVQEGDIVAFKIKVNSRKTKEAKEKVEGMIEILKNRGKGLGIG